MVMNCDTLLLTLNPWPYRQDTEALTLVNPNRILIETDLVAPIERSFDACGIGHCAWCKRPAAVSLPSGFSSRVEGLSLGCYKTK